MAEKANTTAEVRADGLDAGQLARDGLTATDRYNLLYFICTIVSWKLNSYRYGSALMTFDAKAEARLRRKIDLLVVPIVALIFLFSFIDRANIGMCTHVLWQHFAMIYSIHLLAHHYFRKRPFGWPGEGPWHEGK